MKKENAPSIVVIDDNQSSGLSFAGTLRKNFYKVIHTRDCFRALYEMEEESFDLAIISSNVKDMTPDEIITLFRDQYEIPVIIIVKEEELENFYDEERQPEWKKVVVKPFVPKVILDEIKELVG